MDLASPKRLDLKKDRGLTIEWNDGTTSLYSIVFLRKMSPSADARQLRAEQASNPLVVLPASTFHKGAGGAAGSSLVAVSAELVGNYAIRIRFSDGHDTGIYSWAYLRSLEPGQNDPGSIEPKKNTE